MKTRFLGAACACAFTLAVSTSASAALVSEAGGQLIYDTTLNITWLANANLAASNTFGVSGISSGGLMVWNTAENWIAAMNTANYLGFSDWRLPTTLQPDATCANQSGDVSQGYSCSGSEMGELFYRELGGVAGNSILDVNNGTQALFQNIGRGHYWSGTEYAPNTNDAWGFTFDGWQDACGKSSCLSVEWAVLPGNAAPLPIPAAFWLFGSGLLGLMSVARRKAA